MSNVIPLRPSIPIRCIDASPARSHAEALMRMLVKDKRIPRDDLHKLADLLDPMIEVMESE